MILKTKTNRVIRQAALVFALMITCATANAIDLQEFQQKGLPTDAYPMTFFFSNYGNLKGQTVTENDIIESSYFDESGDHFIFVQPQNRPDDDFHHINIWFFNKENNKAECVFSQDANNYDDLMIMDMDVIFDKTHRDSVYTDAKTRQRITMQEHSSSIVLILKSEIYTGTSHALSSTVLLYPSTKKNIRLDGQRFVSVLHTVTNALMTAEQELAQDYILTTETSFYSEKANYEETDDFIIFNHEHLEPTLHIYSASGKLIKSVNLPEDVIDMVR